MIRSGKMGYVKSLRPIIPQQASRQRAVETKVLLIQQANNGLHPGFFDRLNPDLNGFD